jgi:hypothetical protein
MQSPLSHGPRSAAAGHAEQRCSTICRRVRELHEEIGEKLSASLADHGLARGSWLRESDRPKLMPTSEIIISGSAHRCVLSVAVSRQTIRWFPFAVAVLQQHRDQFQCITLGRSRAALCLVDRVELVPAPLVVELLPELSLHGSRFENTVAVVTDNAANLVRTSPANDPH